MVELQTSRSAGSFRDPGGFIFQRDGVVYRQVNHAARKDYDLLMGSGFYRRLADEGRLIAHEEVDVAPEDPEPWYKVLRPEPIPFISYPYEWCFSQLKDAASLTLAIQREAIDHGMSLKDGSAYNIQFKDGRPVFIDTLSFEAYEEGAPWTAYRQFCQHFLAPLALMSLTDVRLNQLARTNIDGVPLDLAGRLLPWHSRLRPALAIHIHLHAKFTTAYAGTAGPAGRSSEKEKTKPGKPPRPGRRFSQRSLRGLIDHLDSAIRRLRWEPGVTPWSDYYQDNTYTDDALTRKEQVVASYLDRIKPALTWDLGANTGRFSRVAAGRGYPTVAFDLDPGCVEGNYRAVTRQGETRVLPLLLDLTNPSPATGWQHSERASLMGRGPVDAVLALALVHHLAIANNLPLARIAEFLHLIGRWVVIEFVPKGDPQVSRLLASRTDVFPDYHQREFERCFQRFFDIEAAEPLPESGRVLYLMRGR